MSQTPAARGLALCTKTDLAWAMHRQTWPASGSHSAAALTSSWRVAASAAAPHAAAVVGGDATPGARWARSRSTVHASSIRPSCRSCWSPPQQVPWKGRSGHSWRQTGLAPYAPCAPHRLCARGPPCATRCSWPHRRGRTRRRRRRRPAGPPTPTSGLRCREAVARAANERRAEQARRRLSYHTTECCRPYRGLAPLCSAASAPADGGPVACCRRG